MTEAKSGPARWYGLFDYADPKAPALVQYSRDRSELRQRVHAEPDRAWVIEELDYAPQDRLRIVPKYEPDTAASLRALEDLLNRRGGGPQ